MPTYRIYKYYKSVNYGIYKVAHRIVSYPGSGSAQHAKPQVAARYGKLKENTK